MSKTLKEAPITTATARSKLPKGEYPRRLDADSAVWYRKGVRGGVWFARWRNYGPGAAYRQAPIGAANDVNDKPSAGTFTYLQAEAAARAIVETARAELKAAADGPVLRVRDAVENYIAARDAREARRSSAAKRSDASRRLGRYVLGQPARGSQSAVAPAPIAEVAIHALRERDLLEWRNSLPDAMKATTRQRLVNDFKAALNSTYAANRERLPATLPSMIKHGLRSIASEDAREPIARDNQILPDADVARLLRAAREIDNERGWDGDLLRMVLVLAATGARFSQVARLRVADAQIGAGRLMVPASRKGKGGKSGMIAVPIGRDVLDALVPVVSGRPADAVLLERWRSVQMKGGITWQRDRRGPWQTSSELDRPWREIRTRAGMPDVIPYALRHSSIVRGIRANLPLRLVAALHDTSTVMIENHYSKWITSGLENMARAAIVPLISDHGNVVQFTGQRL